LSEIPDRFLEIRRVIENPPKFQICPLGWFSEPAENQKEYQNKNRNHQAAGDQIEFIGSHLRNIVPK